MVVGEAREPFHLLGHVLGRSWLPGRSGELGVRTALLKEAGYLDQQVRVAVDRVSLCHQLSGGRDASAAVGRYLIDLHARRPARQGVGPQPGPLLVERQSAPPRDCCQHRFEQLVDHVIGECFTETGPSLGQEGCRGAPHAEALRHDAPRRRRKFLDLSLHLAWIWTWA
ncbi:hypothetical protein ACH41H_02205 [Streptomyces sp. NPDC020800]|uniref:hypothetical protein n=1 Tax=Streptomyces sp. NPDC020800 TaxID=3365092 RepID=UPI00379B5DF1